MREYRFSDEEAPEVATVATLSAGSSVRSYRRWCMLSTDTCSAHCVSAAEGVERHEVREVISHRQTSFETTGISFYLPMTNLARSFGFWGAEDDEEEEEEEEEAGERGGELGWSSKSCARTTPALSYELRRPMVTSMRGKQRRRTPPLLVAVVVVVVVVVGGMPKKNWQGYKFWLVACVWCPVPRAVVSRGLEALA